MAISLVCLFRFDLGGVIPQELSNRVRGLGTSLIKLTDLNVKIATLTKEIKRCKENR